MTIEVKSIDELTALSSVTWTENIPVEDWTALAKRMTTNQMKAFTKSGMVSSDIGDFDTEVSNNTDVAANTTARHTHTNKTILDQISNNPVETISAGTNVTVSRTGNTVTVNSTASGWHAIEDEWVAITQRDTMNFVWGWVVITDEWGKTTVTIPWGAWGWDFLSDGTVPMSWDINLNGNGLNNTWCIVFDTTPTWESTVEWSIHYNNTDKCIDIISDNMTLQVGQESVIRVANVSGIPLPNGKIVYITGATSNRPTAALARANSAWTSDILGMCTQDIPNGSEWFVTIVGSVRDLNTSGFSAWDTLYLSAATAWEVTNTKPTSPNYIRVIGKVLVSDTTVWVIYVNTSVSRSMDAEQIFEDQLEPMGIPASQKANVNIAYNVWTRVVTVSGTFFYYYKWVKYIKTSVTETVTHDTTIWTKYVYYDGATLTVSNTPFDILSVVPIAIISYNNTTATTRWAWPEGIRFDERHGITMDSMTHYELHNTIGSYVIGSWFSLSGTYSVGTWSWGLVANTFGIDWGTIADEDLITTVSALTDNDWVGNQYPVFYRTGSGTEWRWYTYNVPYLFANSNILYNQYTGWSWQLTEITNNGIFMNMYVCATHALDWTYRFVLIPSQTTYSSQSLATSESILQLDLTGLPFAEIVPLWQICFERQGSYDDNGNCRISATTKIVGTRLAITSAAISQSIHNNLSGRSDTACHPASSIVNTPAGNIAATTVQAAIDELESEKVPTSRTLTINGTWYDLSADRSWTITAGWAFWTVVPGTPVRSDNDTFTVTDNSNTNKYDLLLSRWTILKWTESSTVKQAMVISSSYGANTVTVNIVWDTMASIDSSSLKYGAVKAKEINFSYPPTVGTGTNIMGNYYASMKLKVHWALALHGTAGTTNATTYDINKAGTTMFTTKLSVASAGTVGTDTTADSWTYLDTNDLVTIDCDSVSTTAPTYATVKLFVSPYNDIYLS